MAYAQGNDLIRRKGLTMGRGGLGGGLDSLFEENGTEVQVKKTVRLSEIEPNILLS